MLALGGLYGISKTALLESSQEQKEDRMAVLEKERKDAAQKSRSSQSSGRRNKELGRKGEEAAARFLYKRGYEILERNWTCFAGEADIIARDGECIVFVEVKTRRDCQKGFPSEAVDEAKRSRYEKIALTYLADCGEKEAPVRFDVVALVVIAPDKAVIRHHINAFSVV